MPDGITTRAGLHLPPSVGPAQKRAKRMARKKFLRILAFMERCRLDHGFKMRFTCLTCGQPVKLERGDGLLQTDRDTNTINPKVDVFSLECGCTVWRVTQAAVVS
jgi:hypothetical protein